MAKTEPNFYLKNSFTLAKAYAMFLMLHKSFIPQL